MLGTDIENDEAANEVEANKGLKGPFLGCNWERCQQERILSFPKKGVVCNWERFQ